MANKMLIDATHPEETRVVVVRGNRVEEFDYESASRKQLRGNIYLAKVTRVEPSLQAAFIEYGGNRHGFLAFSEIHPDYYQIPVADRLALIEEEERAARLADDEAELREKRRERGRSKRARPDASVSEEAASEEADEAEDAEVVASPEDLTSSGAAEEPLEEAVEAALPVAGSEVSEPAVSAATDAEAGEAPSVPVEEAPAAEAPEAPETAAPVEEPAALLHHVDTVSELLAPAEAEEAKAALVEAAAESEMGEPLPVPAEQAGADEAERRREAQLAEFQPAPILPEDEAAPAETPRPSEDEDEDEDDGDVDQIDEEEEIEHLGADEDALEEVPERAPQRRARSYKIQEVIRRRQVMLVQVVKEERGNKGAALTTYLSLAGRYSVLMPNTARGGGISRKITNAVDRKRLKEVVQDLEVPEGMGIILRTAGANRTKTEIKRDFEYLLRLWETVRELTLSSAAPSLVYEEGSLIKRAIRDLYNKDIDDIQVAGEDGYKEAKDFMRMLMPSHAKTVLPYREPQPIFARFGVEQQLDAMFSPVVQLKSGGYIVINPTEALVSIDVNSGRATREHHIEDTALKTNVEAAEEIARQLRLRDLAGLIVIDFIDMEEKRNNRAVERKLKDCLKNDRARIQIGRISHFGLLEMSRQRIRTGVLESSIEVCPHCGGTGHVRSAASVALQLLRALEEQLLRSASHNLVARTRAEVALYVLNQKRAHLHELEERFHVTLIVEADETVTGHQPFAIDKGDLAAPPAPAPRAAPVVHPDSILPDESFVEDEEEEVEEVLEAEAESEDGTDKGDDNNRRRRRRRRRRKPGEREDSREASAEGEDEDEPTGETPEMVEAAEGEESDDEGQAEDEFADGDEGDRRRRRRGRRGGRRNRREREGEDGATVLAEGEEGAADEAPADSVAITGEASIAAPEEGGEGGSAAEAAALPAAGADLSERVSEDESAAPAIAETAGEEPAAEGGRRPRRRRSTVREKAPVVAEGAEAQEPVDGAPVEGAPLEVAPAAKPAVAEVSSASEGVPSGDLEPAQEGVSPEGVSPEASAPEGSEAPAETPAEPPLAEDVPTPPEVASDPAAKPRSGWWQRKLFGG